MKKGFTLVELISVIALVALVFLLVIPGISSLINNKKDDISSTMNEVLYNASNLYMSNDNIYHVVNGNVYCIKLESLVDREYLTNPIIDPVTQNEISKDKYVKVSVMDNKYNYSISDECEEMRLNDTQLVVSNIKIEPYQDYYNLTFDVNDDVTKVMVNSTEIDLNNLVYEIDEIVDGEVFTLKASTASQTKEYNITTYVDETDYSGTSSTYTVNLDTNKFYIASLVDSKSSDNVEKVNNQIKFSNLPYTSGSVYWSCPSGTSMTIFCGCCSASGSWDDNDDTIDCGNDTYCQDGYVFKDSNCNCVRYKAKLTNLYYNYYEAN